MSAETIRIGIIGTFGEGEVGALLLTLGSDRDEQGAGDFDRPEGAVVRGVDVWFSGTYNDRIVRHRVVERAHDDAYPTPVDLPRPIPGRGLRVAWSRAGQQARPGGGL